MKIILYTFQETTTYWVKWYITLVCSPLHSLAINCQTVILTTPTSANFFLIDVFIISRSKWHSDPYTQGSYSYLSMDCDENSILEIARPEVSNVFCDQVRYDKKL